MQESEEKTRATLARMKQLERKGVFWAMVVYSLAMLAYDGAMSEVVCFSFG